MQKFIPLNVFSSTPFKFSDIWKAQIRIIKWLYKKRISSKYPGVLREDEVSLKDRRAEKIFKFI